MRFNFLRGAAHRSLMQYICNEEMKDRYGNGEICREVNIGEYSIVRSDSDSFRIEGACTLATRSWRGRGSAPSHGNQFPLFAQRGVYAPRLRFSPCSEAKEFSSRQAVEIRDGINFPLPLTVKPKQYF